MLYCLTSNRLTHINILYCLRLMDPRIIVYVTSLHFLWATCGTLLRLATPTAKCSHKQYDILDVHFFFRWFVLWSCFTSTQPTDKSCRLSPCADCVCEAHLCLFVAMTAGPTPYVYPATISCNCSEPWNTPRICTPLAFDFTRDGV